MNQEESSKKFLIETGRCLRNARINAGHNNLSLFATDAKVSERHLRSCETGSRNTSLGIIHKAVYNLGIEATLVIHQRGDTITVNSNKNNNP